MAACPFFHSFQRIRVSAFVGFVFSIRPSFDVCVMAPSTEVNFSGVMQRTTPKHLN